MKLSIRRSVLSAVGLAPAPETTTEEPEPPAKTDTPTLDLACTLLKNDRRRRVIQYLAATDPDAWHELGDLTDRLAATEHPADPVGSDERKAVYVSLYQTHLPKLDGAGVVVFDSDRTKVRAGPAFDAVHDFLTDARETFPTADPFGVRDQ